MRTLVLALLLVLPALAGCFAPDAPVAVAEPGFEGLSPVVYTLTLAEPTPIAAEDGTTLDAWVFRPDANATSEKVPVIINFSPYWSNLSPPAASGGDPFSQYLIDFYVPRGYAVALVSARGTGLSEGCFTIGGPQEVADVDLVATFLAERPWSNGNVSAVAKSYDGTMAQALLTRNNPHVRTIVPVAPISEFYKYNYVHGVPYENGVMTNTFNTDYVLATSVNQNADPTDPTWRRTPTRICPESVDVQTGQYHALATGDYGPYWQARNYTAMLPDEIGASVFYIHGLEDWNVKPDHMDPWIRELQSRGVTLKMMLGQWGHDYPHRDDFNRTLLAWFDQTLKGVDTGILREPLVHVQDSEGVWHEEDAWPPARAQPVRLHTSAEGALVSDPGAGESRYADGGALGGFGPIPGAASPVSTLRFDSTPVEKPLRIEGSPVLHALVSSTGPRATLSATLLVDGAVVNQAFLDLAHRGDVTRTEPMPANEAVEVQVPFYPMDQVLREGSVVTLLLGHAPPPDALVTVRPAPTGSLVTIHHGDATWIELPALAVEDARVESPQPQDVGCWTC